MNDWLWLNWTLMGLSIAVLFYLGIRSMRIANSNDEAGFLIAGKSLGPFVGAASIMATGYSGWGFVGSPGVAYQYGAIEVLGNFLFAPAFVFAILFFARALRERAEALGSYTIPEYIARQHSPGGRWSRALQAVSAVIMVVLLLVFLTSQIKAVGLMGAEWLGIDLTSSASLMVTIIVLYTLMGGLAAVAWTDTLMLCGMMIAGGVILAQIVGETGLVNLVDQLRAIEPSLVNPADSGPYGDTRGSVFTILLYATLWAAVLPYMGMRFMAFRPSVDMRTVALYAAPMGVVLSLVPLVGLYVRAQIGGLDDPDNAMPVYLEQFLHPALAALITLCILFAMKSTANSILHAVSSAVSHDLRRALLPNRDVTPQGALAINRMSVAVLGVVGLVMMLYAPPFLLSWLGILGTGTLLAATVAPVFVSVFWRGNAFGALAAMVGGTVTSGGLLLFTGVGWMLGPLAGCAASSATYVIVSLATFAIQPRCDAGVPAAQPEAGSAAAS